MKTILKFLTLGLMLVAFGAASATSTFAQTVEECDAIYQKFLKERKGPDIATYESAIAGGKSYLEKCGSLPDQEEVKKYVTAQVPKIEKIVVELIKNRDIFEPFNKSVPAKDWATAFRTGKLVINETPDDVDVPLVLASIGFDLSVATPAVDTYNADAISMAKLALQKMEQGKGSGTTNYGAFAYTYKSKDCADGKLNATGWMNYTIGSIMYYRLKQTKEALPYLYKASQSGCETKEKIANIYRTIGAWYIEEFRLLEVKRNAKYEELQTLEKNKDPKLADAEKEYDTILGLQKGYMERVMDSYARAYKVALKVEKPEFSNALLTRAKEFYGYRYNKDMSGFDTWLNGLSGKAFPDPTVAVTPIMEAATTTGSTPMTTTTDTGSSSATTADTRPRSVGTGTPAAKTTPATTTTTPATKPATTAATTTKKAPAKKPAPKKKGTR